MSHDLHQGPYRVFADGCVECETRARRGLAAVQTVDESNRYALGSMVLEIRRGTPPMGASRLDLRIAGHLIEAALMLDGVGLSVEDVIAPTNPSRPNRMDTVPS